MKGWIKPIKQCQYDVVLRLLNEARYVPEGVLCQIVLHFRGVERTNLLNILFDKHHFSADDCNLARQTALMFASMTEDCLDIIQFLVTKGASINAQDESGHTALMGICRNNPRLDIVKYFVEHGYDVNIQSKRGYTALMALMRQKKPCPELREIAQYFVEHGAKLDTISVDGQTLLAIAACHSNHNLDVFRYLIECGSPLESSSKPPLYWATKYSVDAVRMLLNAGANVNALCTKRKTILDCVSTSSMCSLEAIMLLVEAGAMFDRRKVKREIVHAAYLARYPVYHIRAITARLRAELVQLTIDKEGARALLPKTDLFVGDNLPLIDILALPYRRVLDGVTRFFKASRRFYDWNAIREELDCAYRDLSNTLHALAISAHTSTVVRNALLEEEERTAKRGRNNLS